MSAAAKPSFGFGSLDDFRPARAETLPSPAPHQAVDQVAERLGFASREAVVRRRRRPPIEGPTDQINIRASTADINAFVEWCEKNRFSYREGFAELVRLIPGPR